MTLEVAPNTSPTAIPQDSVKQQNTPHTTAESLSRSSSTSSSSSNSGGKKDHPRSKRHKKWYLWEGNIVIQVEYTLFRLRLSTLHEHSPVFRTIVPPITKGSLPLVGYNDRRPLVLYEVSTVDFLRLLPMLCPADNPDAPETTHSLPQLFSILKLATRFQMDGIRHMAMLQLLALPMDPIRRIALWDEFHLDSELLLPSFATVTQRSEPLTMPMTMALGLRTFTNVAAARDLYRQRVGCCLCRKSLSEEESQAVAEDVVRIVFAEVKSPTERPML